MRLNIADEGHMKSERWSCLCKCHIKAYRESGCRYSSTNSHPSITGFKQIVLERIYSTWRDGGVCVNVNGHRWWGAVNTVLDTRRRVMAALILIIVLLWLYTVWSGINLAEIKTGLLPTFHPEEESIIFLRKYKLTVGYNAIVVNIMMNMFV